MTLGRGALLAGALVVGVTAAAARSPIVGGAAMSPSKNIVENAGASAEFSTLVAGIKAAGLVATLSGPGPFTVFAPTNAAFRKLPAGTVDNLLRPENKAQLQTVLTYHVVPGLLTTKDLIEQIKAGGGKAQLKTVEGEPLTVELKGREIQILDVKGDLARIGQSNVMQSNGVIQVINTVLLP